MESHLNTSELISALLFCNNKLLRQVYFERMLSLLLIITFFASKDFASTEAKAATRVLISTFPLGFLMLASSVCRYFRLTRLSSERMSIERRGPLILESMKVEMWLMEPNILVSQEEYSGTLRTISIFSDLFSSNSESSITPLSPSSERMQFLVPVSPSTSNKAQSSQMVSTLRLYSLLVRLMAR